MTDRPTPKPADPERHKEATAALEASHRQYLSAVVDATAAVQTGDRLRQVRIRNGLGPALAASIRRSR